MPDKEPKRRAGKLNLRRNRMRFVKYPIALLAVASLTASPAGATEVRTFIGVDSVETETELKYLNGKETYNLEQLRLRFGWEVEAGGSFGFELLSGDKDDTLDPFGTPFEYEADPAIGIYATLGKPVYLKIGWSRWHTTYTDLSIDLADTENVDSYEIGFGVNLLLGRTATIYADYTLRDTDSKYPKHLTNDGLVDLESELVSVGLNILF